MNELRPTTNGLSGLRLFPRGPVPVTGFERGSLQLPALPVRDWLPICRGQCQYYIYANVDPCFDPYLDCILVFLFLFFLTIYEDISVFITYQIVTIIYIRPYSITAHIHRIH